MLLSITGAYRTASTEALQVIAGVLPIKLKIEERCEIHRRRSVQRKFIKTEMNAKWQREWALRRAEWTSRIIPDVTEWNGGKKQVEYYSTQILTGNGCFNQYLHRFKIRDSGTCSYCEEVDTAEHTILQCERWKDERVRLEGIVGRLRSRGPRAIHSTGVDARERNNGQDHATEREGGKKRKTTAVIVKRIVEDCDTITMIF